MKRTRILMVQAAGLVLLASLLLWNGCGGTDSPRLTSGETETRGKPKPPPPPPPPPANPALVGYRATNYNTASLWAINADGSNSQPLTDDAAGNFDAQARWSPDATHIAYRSHLPSSQIPGRRFGEVCLLDITIGSTGVIQVTGRHNLTNSEIYQDGLPVWSPDGTQLAIYSDRERGGTGLENEGNHDLYLIDSHTGAQECNLSQQWLSEWANQPGQTNPVDEFPCDWKGDWLLFMADDQGTYDLYALNLVTGDRVPLTPGTPETSEGWAAWSTDGTRIAYSVIHPDWTLDRSLPHYLAVMELGTPGDPTTGGTPYKLVDPGDNPTWRPDGQKIACLSGTWVRQKGQWVYTSSLSLVSAFLNPDGSRPIPETIPNGVDWAHWRPNWPTLPVP